MDRSHEILVRLRVVGPIALAISTLLVGLVVSGLVRGIVVNGAGSVVAAGSAGLASQLMRGGPDGSGTLPIDKLDSMVRERIEAGQLAAYRLSDPSGKVLYSTWEGETALGRPADSDFEAVLEGMTRVRVVDGTTIGLGAPDHDRLMAVLAPVNVPAREGAKLVGVVETYRDYSKVSTSVRDSVLVVWAAVLVGAVVMAGGLGYVLNWARRELDDTERRVSTLNVRLRQALLDVEEQSVGILKALSEAVDAKDSYTARHSLGVTDVACRIGLQLGFGPSEIAALERAALLHDIGKIGVPENLLLKPAALKPAEFDRVKEHADAGARIIGTIPFLAEVVPIVRHHHERWDGDGYPERLRGEEIPISARVLAVADAFDAMTTDRPYRRAIIQSAAVEEIERCSGSQFDPTVVEAFRALVAFGTIREAASQGMMRKIAPVSQSST